MPKFFGVAFGVSWSCALVAGVVCAAEVEGQTRALPSAGTTMQASATILPSLDAASYSSMLDDRRLVADAFARRSTRLVTTTRAPEPTTTSGSFRVDPPVARSFERTTSQALRHTIAVLY